MSNPINRLRIPGAQPAPSVPEGVSFIDTSSLEGVVSTEIVHSYPPPSGWLRAIDEALVVAHLGVANASDTYEQAKAKLDSLIGFHVDVATDPAVNGGYKLMPIEPTRESRHARSRPGGQAMTDHANELRRHARKIPHPQGETPGVMLRAADEIERLRAKIAEMERQEPVQPAPIEQDTSVRKAWARFSNELHRSPDAPYPGMSEAFEQHFSQSFIDREWRSEAATWAAAWKAAKRHCAQPAPSVPEVTDAMAIAFHAALTDGGIGLQEVEEIKTGLRAALAAAPEAKP